MTNSNLLLSSSGMSKRGYVDPEINHPEGGVPLFVGRDPGAQEVREGRPFVGQSGSLLFGGYDNLAGRPTTGVIEASGLSRDQVNITNRVLKRPWNNDFYRHSWDDINDGLRELRELIEQLQPSIIVTFGAQAAYDLVPNWSTLTDRKAGENSGGASIKSAKAILDRRGFFWYPETTGLPCPLLTTLHPAACIYQPMPNRVMLDIDMQRLGSHLDGTLVREPWPDFTRITCSGDMERIWNADLVSYDIEVKWGAAFLCIAFYTSDGHAFLAYEDGLGACVEWLRSDRPKMAHNSQFDRYYLDAKLDIPVGGRHEDTIVAHWSLYPELAGKEDTGREDQRKKSKNQATRKGLNFLASMHLDRPWWKTYTSDAGMMGRLCVNDVIATMDCWKIMEPDIDEMQVRYQYERQLAKLPALIQIQKRGMRIDEALRQLRVDEIGSRQEELYDASQEAAEDFLKAHSITHNDDGDEYWWYHDARCECCFGGSAKREHCDVCAGIKGTGSGGSILKGDLVMWAWRNTDIPKKELDGMKKEELTDLIPPCKVCGGEGKIPTWDFNPMSHVQLPEILWTYLGVPKYCAPGGPSASEEIIKNVLEWSES